MSLSQAHFAVPVEKPVKVEAPPVTVKSLFAAAAGAVMVAPAALLANAAAKLAAETPPVPATIVTPPNVNV